MEPAAADKGLRLWRRSAGLTQQMLARLACVSRAGISHVERGRQRPSVKFAGKICRALSSRLGRRVEPWQLFPADFAPLPFGGSVLEAGRRASA